MSAMSQVTVTIAGHTYRMACGEGEEAQLESLAALYDSKIAAMRASFGEIGDMRLHVMAAITLADELMESRRRAEALQQELGRLRTMAGDDLTQLVQAQTAETIAKVAERIERLAKSLNPTHQPAPGP